MMMPPRPPMQVIGRFTQTHIVSILYPERSDNSSNKTFLTKTIRNCSKKIIKIVSSRGGHDDDKNNNQILFLDDSKISSVFLAKDLFLYVFFYSFTIHSIQ